MNHSLHKHSVRIRWFFTVALLLAIIALRFTHSKKSSIIPADIKQHIVYDIYVPDVSQRQWTVPASSVSYNNNQGVLSYTTVSADNKIVITEQNTPSQFTDIPQYYPALLGKLNEYSEIQTALGTVALTHPKELNGGQTAIINSHGTLMFIRPQNNLSDSAWKVFIDSLNVIK